MSRKRYQAAVELVKAADGVRMTSRAGVANGMDRRRLRDAEAAYDAASSTGVPRQRQR